VRALAFLTAAAFLIACGGPAGGNDGGSGGPKIGTLPNKIDFGFDAGTAVAVGLVGTQDLVISNTGGGTLTLNTVTLTGDPEFTATRPSTMSLGAGEKVTVTVTFSPTDVKTYSGQVAISSNATNVPSAGVQVRGVGKAP
jgi:hypothetical protein